MKSRSIAVCRAATFVLLAVLALAVACNKRETSSQASRAKNPAEQATRTPKPAEQGPQALKPAAVNPKDTSIVAPEDEAATKEEKRKPGSLVLPVTFERHTGDLDDMRKRRTIRALITINPISFFYVQGRPAGMTFEAVQELERFVNKKYGTGPLKVRVKFIPMRPDQLESALTQGLGDVIAQGVIITPAREQRVAFTVPVQRNVTQVVVTGKDVPSGAGFDALGDKPIYANPVTDAYDNLNRVSEERQKAGKPPLTVKAADKALLRDDLIEMVNAGLIPATVAVKARGELWAKVLPNIRVQPNMVVSTGADTGWVVRKNNPELKKVLDEFVKGHREGTSFGNTLLRRYLQNTKWVKNSISPEEMKKFVALVDFFKKYSDQNNFDYLMIAAQAYQESLLDQSKRSPSGAVGVMQVIPKYAAAPPINVKDVGTADKNILAGVKMLRHITDTYFNDPAISRLNKTLFTFASYNAGQNRIVRLRKKAAADGLDPNQWFGNVELEVAKDIGQETVTYVDNIYKYYVAYKLTWEQKMNKQKGRAATATE
jgi:membrane-bound lytic murein transglycosylase MltF